MVSQRTSLRVLKFQPDKAWLSHMKNVAGIFQVDELLKQNLVGSGIENYIVVSAYQAEEQDSKPIKEFEDS